MTIGFLSLTGGLAGVPFGIVFEDEGTMRSWGREDPTLTTVPLAPSPINKCAAFVTAPILWV